MLPLPVGSCPKLNKHTFLVADLMLDWTKEYGNTYQIRLFTDNRVRVFVPYPWSIKKPSPAVYHGRTSPCQGT